MVSKSMWLRLVFLDEGPSQNTNSMSKLLLLPENGASTRRCDLINSLIYTTRSLGLQFFPMNYTSRSSEMQFVSSIYMKDLHRINFCCFCCCCFFVLFENHHFPEFGMVAQQMHFTVLIVVIMTAGAARVKILLKKKRWPLGHIARLKTHLKSTNTYDDQEKQKLIFFLRIE